MDFGIIGYQKKDAAEWIVGEGYLTKSELKVLEKKE